jgi:transcriptional regulator with XRE-family HTH domain
LEANFDILTVMNEETKKVSRGVGSKLKKARETAGKTQADVAEAAGINVNYYAQIERGEVDTSVEKLQRIMKVLKMKSLDLV